MDVETSISNKGNPFDVTNVLVTIQIKQGDKDPIVYTKNNFNAVKDILDNASCIIAFNSKFDLNWLQRELGFKAKCVWCAQLAEFIFSAQRWKYPDLDTTCENYGIGRKLDIVKTEYWEKGIDTPDIPIEILTEYGAQDVILTWEVFKKQVERFKGEHLDRFLLFRLHCNDLLVLQEMEFNGIKYETQQSIQKSEELDKSVKLLETKLNVFTDNIPINFDSNDHVSVMLYGGTICEKVRLPIGVYKTGNKTGQTRYKITEKQYVVERKVEPLKNSALKKEGYYSTDEATLTVLKANATTRKIIGWLLERTKILKLQSTYLLGLPKTLAKYNWQDDILHSTLNQCVAITGRLSSTKPNQQNLCKEVKRYCVSRYT